MDKIGDFSKQCEVTIKTLRYYDKVGLLVPDYIDNFTGYRYYGPEKVTEMRRITELKSVGFTLKEIKKILSGDTTVIQKKRQKLEQQLENLNKLNLGEKKVMKKDFNAEFENDERVIGRWEMIGDNLPFNEIYFLPNGEEYWIFSWTKGYLKISSEDGNMLCPYTLKATYGENPLMSVQYGESTWILKQTDNKPYTKYEIGRHDNIDLPFVDDTNVIGKWVSVDFVKKVENFDPAKQSWPSLFFKSIEFYPNGEAGQIVGEAISPWKIRWTKGTTLVESGDGTKAPAYEIYTFDGMDYLFLEWKSGDYTWGKRKARYYVFKRAD